MDMDFIVNMPSLGTGLVLACVPACLIRGRQTLGSEEGHPQRSHRAAFTDAAELRLSRWRFQGVGALTLLTGGGRSLPCPGLASVPRL